MQTMNTNVINLKEGGGTVVHDDVELLSEHRKQAVRIMGETVILTVKYEPVRVDHELLPYYGIYQIIRNGKLVDEEDGPMEGHNNWEDAFETITRLAKENIAADHADRRRTSQA